jgi:glycine amidinotransferase
MGFHEVLNDIPLILADDEWSPLEAVIVGRAEDSAFASEHIANFKPLNPFPLETMAKAQQELDYFASLLQEQGIRIYRPRKVNWLEVGGYTGAMPRDGLMTVESTLIGAPFAWRFRRQEISLGYYDILSELSSGGTARICRAPVIVGHDTLCDGLENNKTITNGVHGHQWAISNSRPAFDAADFMRFGKTILGQLSNVTNLMGLRYLRAVVPEGYTVELLNTTDEHAMQIDATILPLRKGLMVYNPERVTEHELRQHEVLHDWNLLSYSFIPQPRKHPSPPPSTCFRRGYSSMPSAWMVSELWSRQATSNSRPGWRRWAWFLSYAVYRTSTALADPSIAPLSIW